MEPSGFLLLDSDSYRRPAAADGKEASTTAPPPNPGQNEDVGPHGNGGRGYRHVLVDDSRPVENHNAASAEGHHARSRDLGLVSDIARLESMVDSDLSVSRAYSVLKTKLYPAIRQEGVTIPQIFFPVVSKLMLKMINVKNKNMSATDLPPVAEIFRVCLDVGEIDPRLWSKLVEKLVEGLCEMSVSPADYPSIEAFEKHLATRDEMLTDLVESWKVLSLPKHAMVNPMDKENDIIDGFWFPRLEKSSAYRLPGSGNFVSAFSSLFSQYDQTKLGPRVSTLAIATYALLLDRQRSNANVRQGAARFMAKIAYMISTVRLRSEKLGEYLSQSSAASPATARYIMEQWPNISESLDGGKEHTHPRGPASRNAAAGHAKPYSPHRVSIEKRLSRAYGTRHLAEVDRIWHDFIGKPADFTPERAAALREEQDIFNSFINTYMALNDPDKAIVVWNTLPRLGMKPTLKTWNVMLDGCRKARNLNGLKTVWSRLQASGLALDIPIWTTRVAGLIDCGDPKGAIEALEELVKRWHLGQKGQQGDALKLAIEPVNAAMAGLVRLDKLKAAQSLLSWSSRQGILKGLLETMKTLGINADAATFTVVLDGTLANVPLNDYQSQAEVVRSVFETMEGAGLRSNLHTYGKMIYLLLRSGDRAQESVKIVLSHLWSQGYELSPHIYTMLVEHYFARQPPDLDAVNGLLLRRRLLDYDDMDRVFYDRVIKGYAHVGELGTALDIYRKLHAAGFMVELETQFDLLRALLRTGTAQGEHEARQLVEGTMARFKELHAEDWQSPQHARFWGHAFWHLAVRSGVLQELSVTTDKMAAV
ncbi:uncharacterized protein PG986_008262 [Apiospora aurea]|uniref:Pentatricopeptide repeat-containing protein n=1 Tax=Apiospora aurea TaxID=335848 RepID=A0ABR1QEW6_9PEZI